MTDKKKIEKILQICAAALEDSALATDSHLLEAVKRIKSIAGAPHTCADCFWRSKADPSRCVSGRLANSLCNRFRENEQ